ncbi:hypothetical protein VPH35_099135 [Triticum aestivum]
MFLSSSCSPPPPLPPHLHFPIWQAEEERKERDGGIRWICSGARGAQPRCSSRLLRRARGGSPPRVGSTSSGEGWIQRLRTREPPRATVSWSPRQGSSSSRTGQLDPQELVFGVTVDGL